MTQPSAPMSPAIKVTTGLVLAMIAALFLAAGKVGGMLWAGAAISVFALFCYLRAPVAYEIAGDELTVRFRLGRKVFPAVTGCETFSASLPRGVRLWGNGGLFAATGIFWNQPYGIYRAYITSARYQDYVLVATRTRKILISPENPAEFVKTWRSSAPAAPAPG